MTVALNDAMPANLASEGTLKPKRMHYGDLVRILGTIAVVVGHVCDNRLFYGEPVLSRNWWVLNGLDAMTRWAVPVYIMLSGALLLDPARNEPATTFYRKRLMRIGIPLAFWTAFFMLFSIYYTKWVTPTQAWKNLMVGEPYAHLHFIYRIAGLYAFTPMIRVFLRHTSREMLLGAVILCLGMSSLDSVMSSILATKLTMFLRFAPFVGYYLCGYLLRETIVSDRQLKWCWIGTAACVILIVAGTGVLVAIFHNYSAGNTLEGPPRVETLLYDFLSPVRVVYAVFVWLILVRGFHKPWPESEKGRSIVTWWAGLTLSVYLIHPMFREIWHQNGWTATRFNVWITVPLLTLMVYLPSVALAAIIEKIPYVRKIGG